MIECFLALFSLMSQCIDFGSIYCSSVFETKFVIYFKIYVIGYVGETMKTCSIISSIAFSLERLLLTSRSKNALLKRFESMKFRKFCWITIGFGFVISINKIFEYDAEADRLFIREGPVLFNNVNHLSYWFIAIFVIHYVLIDLVCLVINFVIDIFLATAIRDHIKQKRSNSIHLKNDQSDTDSKLDSVEAKTNRMLFYLFFFYFICRLPELIFYMHLLFLSSDKNLVSQSWKYYCINKLCTIESYLIEFIYLISYSFTILIYFKFNSKFSKGFNRLILRRVESDSNNK